jgi:hypothetical protein
VIVAPWDKKDDATNMIIHLIIKRVMVLHRITGYILTG